MGRPTASGEPHDHDPSGVDSGVLGEEIQRAVRVDNHDPATKLILIISGADNTSPSEAIDNESRDYRAH